MRPWRNCKKPGTSRLTRLLFQYLARRENGVRRQGARGAYSTPLARKRRPMDENLIGYLLNALDSDTRQETEKYLLKNREARERLNRMTEALAPLEADRDAIDPPPGLWARTLARVAEFQCRQLPSAPR